MNINILKKHIAVGEKRPFNTSDAASVRKEQKLDPKELREKLNDLIKKTFPCKIGFEFIDHFIQGLSQKQLNEFIKQLDAEPTGVEGFPFEENNVLDWVLYSHNEKTIMMPLFHLVARYGSKDSIKAVLKWAEQNDTQLGLLTDAVTGNDKELNGFTFFHLVARYGSKDSIEAVLKWAEQNDTQLGILTDPVTGE